MTETCISNPRQRQIIRHADFDLPEYWEHTIGKCCSNFHYKSTQLNIIEIRALFDKTMANHYTEYSSYRSYSK